MTVRAMAQTFKSGRAEDARTRPTMPTGEKPNEESAFRLARDLIQTGQPGQALQILDAEVAQGRESSRVLRLIARAASQLGDPHRARRALERAAELAPDDVVTHVRLARVLLQSVKQR